MSSQLRLSYREPMGTPYGKVVTQNLEEPSLVLTFLKNKMLSKAGRHERKPPRKAVVYSENM